MPRDPKVIYLQNLYGAGQDSAPQGRDSRVSEQTTYEKTHARYHAFFEEYAKDLNVHDIFLIDRASSSIIYSTRKELDFATNVVKGAWKESPLATVYKNALAAAEGEVVTTDFEHYPLASHLPVAFVAAPVRDGATTVAVLVLEVSVDDINAVMTDNENWQEHGLGATGETYIVGPDYTMRSDSRFLLESRQQFLAWGKNSRCRMRPWRRYKTKTPQFCS